MQCFVSESERLHIQDFTFISLDFYLFKQVKRKTNKNKIKHITTFRQERPKRTWKENSWTTWVPSPCLRGCRATWCRNQRVEVQRITHTHDSPCENVTINHTSKPFPLFLFYFILCFKGFVIADADSYDTLLSIFSTSATNTMPLSAEPPRGWWWQSAEQPCSSWSQKCSSAFLCCCCC